MDVESPLARVASDRLRGASQRITPHRAALLDALADAGHPLTIPELLKRAPGLAQSSAYRNLVLLEEVGVVHRVVTDGEHARYELDQGLTGHHHHHLVCTICGSVEDVAATDRLERSVESAISEIEEATGFRAADHRVDVIGRCRRCA